MSKFNQRGARPTGRSPFVTADISDGTTHEGGAGFSRDVKSELFMLGVSNFVSEQSFYETAVARDARYRELVRKATLSDPEWTARFLAWLRNEANMRSASLVGAAEFARARLDSKLSGLSRQVISSVIQRADEPGEMLAYWTSNYGRAIPKPVKRGVADACTRVLNEYSFHKYNSDKSGFKIADVLDLVHPTPKDERQSTLFAYAVSERHSTPFEVTNALPLTEARKSFYENFKVDPDIVRNQTMIREAGLTWENVISLAPASLKREAWESVIPSMGYMALLRNLRNFDEAGVSQATLYSVAQRLTDPEQVAKSRQLPYRFLSAYLEVGNNSFWSYPLEKALDLSLKNIPEFKGETFILVDTSGSMTRRFSDRSQVTMMHAGALFGAALAQSSLATLYGFASGLFMHPVYPHNSILSTTRDFLAREGEVGHGTQIWANVSRAIQGRKSTRVVVITDEQSADSATNYGINPNLPIYFFNIGGYATSTVPGAGVRNRYTFGGLTDHTFKLIPLLERGAVGDWPF